MEKDKRVKPVSQRITYEVDGVQRRLGWIAENRPEFLIQTYVEEFPNNSSAILSALAKVGYTRPKMMESVRDHPEWGVDSGVLQQY